MLYKIIMRSFIIYIFNENSSFSNNCTFLIRVYVIKFSFIFKFIKHFIFRILKNVIIAVVQIKTRNFRFRNFNLNIVIMNIKFKLFLFFLRDNFVFLDIQHI